MSDDFDFKNDPVVVVFGNLAEGHHVVGPFKGWDAAAEYAEDHYDCDYVRPWGQFIMPLRPPESP